MSPKVHVLDYGVGNLHSVQHSLEHCGAEVVVTTSATAAADAERLVLPGVGAFRDGMKGLRDAGFVEPILEFAQTGRPFLGICLGMQMMFETSEEAGTHEGLGLLAGDVVPVPPTGRGGEPHKIPHIGWNRLLPTHGDRLAGDLLHGLPEEAAVYFVHSFHAAPADPMHLTAHCDYNGCRIAAVVQKGSMAGCQFHPEKSGPVGLRILRNFLKM